MCPWMAWYGQPARIEELLFKVRHGIVDARFGAQRAEGYGFGLGWYAGAEQMPDIHRSLTAADSDPTLRELAAQTESRLFLAHARDAGDAEVHQDDCHPFQHGRWLFVHNGALCGFNAMRDELMLAIDPYLLDNIHGSTDSEVLFHLALTFGLQTDPVGALERAVAFVQQAASRRGIARAVTASIGVTDGETLWAVRYATLGSSPPLYVLGDVHALQMLYPDNPRLQRLRTGDRIVVSRPLFDFAGAWDPVPESTVVVVTRDGADVGLFRPAAVSPTSGT